MRNFRHTGGRGRHFTHPALSDRRRGDHHDGFGPESGLGPDRHPGHHRGHEGRGRGGRRGPRLFDYGELRLLVLALLAENPAHGYELIKGIEERFGGSYTPSPGVIYPTLSWLEDMGYTVVEASEGARKRHRVTDEGTAFLAANRAAADVLLARSSGMAGPEGRRAGVPAPVIRAMENLKLAMRLRFREGPIDEAAADAIAAAIDEAARIVEKSK
ncbi:MAG TPA: PadR family transcriptional regulator [Sphingobium sp.]